MRIQKTKEALILIYILFLVTIAIVFSTILINNNAFLFNISRYFDVDAKLYSNISSDAEILVNINKEVNSNGDGYIDIISCPQGNTVIMSGSLDKTQIKANLTYTGGLIHCLGTLNGEDVKLLYNSGYTDFNEATYGIYNTTLTNGLGDAPFGDSDNTIIDFASSNYTNTDNIDDNFNSDNYRVNSTGAVGDFNLNYYPDGYQDDDVLGRKQLFGYVANDFGFKKVFWNTSKVLKIIDENYNNGDTLNMKIGDVTNGILHFDVDKDFNIRIVEFDRTIYDELNELRVLDRIDGSIGSGVGYLQDNAGTLSLSNSKTGNEKEFDFSNTDYAIFLEGTGTGTLLYKITGESLTGTGIYITPIDDSDDNIIRYIGNEILISETGQYISKETELIFEK